MNPRLLPKMEADSLLLCVFVCLFCLVGRVWVFCVVDILLFLSLACLIGGCGLRETHSGLGSR